MTQRHSRWPLLAGVSSVLFLGGCVGQIYEQVQDAAERKQTAEELKLYGASWMAYHDAHRRGPKNWQELQSLVPAGLQQTLEGKGYQFLWGVAGEDMRDGMFMTAIAFPGDAATNGGVILCADGSARYVTAEEFDQQYRAIVEKHQRPAQEQAAAIAATQSEAPLPTFQFGDKAYIGSRHVVIVAVLPDNNYRVQDFGASGSVIIQWIVAASKLSINPSADAPATTTAAVPQPATSSPSPSPPASHPESPAPTPTATPVAATAPKTGGQFERGQKVFAEWAGKWEPVEILEVLAGDKYKIRWTDWGPQWDEIRDGNRLAATAPSRAAPSARPAVDFPEPSPPGGGDAPGTAIAADAPLADGEKVYAFWLGQWTPSEIVGARRGSLVTVRVPSPIPGAPAQEIPLPRHWVRWMGEAPAKTAESKPLATATEEMRTWTDSSGKFKIEAKFIAFAEGKVTLEKPDGVQLKMPQEKLSAADQKFVTEQALRP